MRSLSYAPEAWKILNGIFCVYKPAGVPSKHLQNAIVHNLCKDLNDMEKRPPRELVQLKGSFGKPYEVELVSSYADHELVVGPRYQVQDIKMRPMSILGRNISGVHVLAINDGRKILYSLPSSNFVRTYEVKGQFGLASQTFMADGKIVHKTSFRHIRENALDKILGAMQASHQSLAYQFAGVDLQSQEAYELASKGVVRPGGTSNPILYSIKCIDFNLPHFTLEIQCINETEAYLTELIHQIGIYVRSCAVCTQLRQTRFGHFTLDYALLRKHWTLEHIINNIALCKNMIDSKGLIPSTASITPVKQSDVSAIIQNMQEEIRNENLREGSIDDV